MAAEEAPIQVQILSFQAGWRANYPHTQSTDRKNVIIRYPKYKGGRNTGFTEGPRMGMTAVAIRGGQYCGMCASGDA